MPAPPPAPQGATQMSYVPETLSAQHSNALPLNISVEIDAIIKIK